MKLEQLPSRMNDKTRASIDHQSINRTPLDISLVGTLQEAYGGDALLSPKEQEPHRGKGKGALRNSLQVGGGRKATSKRRGGGRIGIAKELNSTLNCP